MPTELVREGYMRDDWTTYFLKLAALVSTRSTCPRARVGTVLVRDNRIISTGYNGAASGEYHCEDGGCVVENNHCSRATHAETNAIGQAAKMGIQTYNSVAYIHDDVHSGRDIGPCSNCLKVLKAAGVKKVITSMPSPEDEIPVVISISL